MAKVHIYTNRNNIHHKTIETDLPMNDVIVSGSIIQFFRNLTPPHTGSYISGSIVTSSEGDSYFEGESYSFEDF